MGLFPIGFLGVDGGVFAGVGYGGGKVYQCHDGNDDYGYIVEYVHGDSDTVESVGVGDRGNGGNGDKEGVGQYYDETEFCGAEFDIGEAEFAFKVCIDAYVDSEGQINGKGKQGQIEVQERGKAGTNEHEPFVYAVNSVVNVVAVDGSLAVANACQGAVERVAKPVDDKTE